MASKKMSKRLKKKVHERDRVCQICEGKNRLQVHHIKERSKYPELANDLDNCILLCESCHTKVHKKKLFIV